MSRALMRTHCPRARAIATAALNDYLFIITGDGYASIVARPGSIVHGVVWRITASDAAALDDYESVTTGLYRRQMITARVQGKLAPMLVYVGRVARPGTPKPGYLDLVLAAARDWNLPNDYVDGLARWTKATAGATAAAARKEQVLT